MLVFTFRKGSRVVIAPGTPHECTVRYLRDDAGGIKIGFTVPPSVEILRGELIDRHAAIRDAGERLDTAWGAADCLARGDS